MQSVLRLQPIATAIPWVLPPRGSPQHHVPPVQYITGQGFSIHSQETINCRSDELQVCPSIYQCPGRAVSAVIVAVVTLKGERAWL